MFSGEETIRLRRRVKIQRPGQRCFSLEKLAIGAGEQPKTGFCIKSACALRRRHIPGDAGMHACQTDMLIQNNVDHDRQICRACRLPGAGFCGFRRPGCLQSDADGRDEHCKEATHQDECCMFPQKKYYHERHQQRRRQSDQPQTDVVLRAEFEQGITDNEGDQN